MTTLGALPVAGGVRFAVHSAHETVLCLFDGEVERRIAMARDGDTWTVIAPVAPGTRYGYRTSIDPAKLLVDPYAVEIDRRFASDPRLARHGEETASLVPKAIVRAPLDPIAVQPPRFHAGGLIYELNVRGFTMLHPDVPLAQRGTIAALAHPSIIAHLQRLHVSAIELMPIAAWIDEPHLAPLGLVNAWGYNPVTMMALDPRLAPGGLVELRATVAALHDAGIGVILDVVFNHSGEGDADGPTLSLRGFDDATYHARNADGTLINDSGTGNTLRTGHPVMRRLILDTLRHFVAQAGVDGFRFDLAPILARNPDFDAAAAIFADIAADPLLADRVMIAEPWDIGAGGYQLGAFPATWLEWNDRYRDDVRRFWCGDGSAGALATRLAGSADIFGEDATRSVNFVAAHDGFTLADCVAYQTRHNAANGEENRDGHGENFSWNCGVEGPTEDAAIVARRSADVAALLATLVASRGTIQITAGDEFGRTQCGNNNAYAQDNAIAWLNWAGRDRVREALFAQLMAWREKHFEVADPMLRHDVRWLALTGEPMEEGAWDDPASPGFIMQLATGIGGLSIRIDRLVRRVQMTEIAADPTPVLS